MMAAQVYTANFDGTLSLPVLDQRSFNIPVLAYFAGVILPLRLLCLWSDRSQSLV